MKVLELSTAFRLYYSFSKSLVKEQSDKPNQTKLNHLSVIFFRTPVNLRIKIPLERSS